MTRPAGQRIAQGLAFLVLAAAAFPAVAAPAQDRAAAPKGEPCAHDRAALMALDYQAFDQDLDGGWRPLAAIAACRGVAADLIRDWRSSHPDTGMDWILYWHEGQLRAMAGDYAAAEALFEQGRRPPPFVEWNLYVDASIAFVRKDKAALEARRGELAALPEPPGFQALAAATEPATGARPSWPATLAVVDGFLACFERPYAEAYRAPCRQGPDPTNPRAPASGR